MERFIDRSSNDKMVDSPIGEIFIKLVKKWKITF